MVKCEQSLNRKERRLDQWIHLLLDMREQRILILVTNNTREFFRVENLGIEDWTQEIE